MGHLRQKISKSPTPFWEGGEIRCRPNRWVRLNVSAANRYFSLTPPMIDNILKSIERINEEITPGPYDLHRYLWVDSNIFYEFFPLSPVFNSHFFQKSPCLKIV